MPTSLRQSQHHVPVPNASVKVLLAGNKLISAGRIESDGLNLGRELNLDTPVRIRASLQRHLGVRGHDLAPYTGSDIEFYKIPESVLEHIGFNPRADAFNNEENSEE